MDKSFEGKLNILVHNASQIYVPEGDTRHPYEIGAPKDNKYGSLLRRFVVQTDEQESKKNTINYLSSFSWFS